MSSPTDEPTTEQPNVTSSEMKRNVDQRERRNALAWFAVGGIMCLLLLGLVYAIRTGNKNGNVAVANGTAITDLTGDVKALRQQILECKNKPANSPGCKVPVVPEPTAVPLAPETIEPKIIAGKPGAEGSPGVVGERGPGPSLAQTLVAVTTWCNQTDLCAAKGPTMAQVAAAVAQYCNARGECTPIPKPGPTGPSGPEGAQGNDAPEITSAQILDGVTSYCVARPGGSCDGQSGPVGPTGPPGAEGSPGAPGDAGPTGKPGRGIESTSCDEDSEKLVVHYTDGDSEQVAGSDCVADILPPPQTVTPDPTP